MWISHAKHTYVSRDTSTPRRLIENVTMTIWDWMGMFQLNVAGGSVSRNSRCARSRAGGRARALSQSNERESVIKGAIYTAVCVQTASLLCMLG